MATLTTAYVGDMLFETAIGKHKIQFDVPSGMGGDNRAPTPPEVFIASLGSCVAAFVVQFCIKHEINTDGMSVDVSYEKASNPTRLTDIKVKVNLPNGTCKQRAKALQRVAEHCPVHETIESIEHVEIVVADRDALALEAQPAP